MITQEYSCGVVVMICSSYHAMTGVLFPKGTVFNYRFHISFTMDIKTGWLLHNMSCHYSGPLKTSVNISIAKTI